MEKLLIPVFIISILLFLFMVYQIFLFYEKSQAKQIEPIAKQEAAPLNVSPPPSVDVKNETPPVNESIDTPRDNYTSSQSSGKIKVGITSSEGVSTEKKLKGIVELKLDEAPLDTKLVIFTLSKDSPHASDKLKSGPGVTPTSFYMIDSDSSDGWSVFVDTAMLENGLYYMFIGVTSQEFGSDTKDPYSAYYLNQVIVEN